MLWKVLKEKEIPILGIIFVCLFNFHLDLSMNIYMIISRSL
jgi:hypothetical protein